MTLLEDFPRALKGAWRLLVWDAEGVNYFDQTIDGFWRSFLVQLLLLPVFYLAIVENHNILSAAMEINPELSDRPMAPLTAFIWANMSSFVLGIIAFPILMIFIARML